MNWRLIIGKRLKQARKRAYRLSQEKLGNQAGITSTANVRMCQYEKGIHSPNFLTMMRIAAVLNTPVAYFYCQDDTLADLILKYGALDKAKKKDLLGFADKLIETPGSPGVPQAPGDMEQLRQCPPNPPSRLPTT
jgi:transcriptional regulator with XRE-family HTH domain